jgi:hypothetical protein
MRATTADWLAASITAHRDTLAGDLGAFAQEQVPFYASTDREQLLRGMQRYFEALARAVADTDMAPLRTYLEQTIATQIQQGAEGATYIELINYADDLVAALIEHEASGAAQGDDARRTARSMGRNARLIVSEVNLKLLIDPAYYDDGPLPYPSTAQPVQPAA